MPVVKLGVRSYQHERKEYGKIAVPAFDIVGWAPWAAESAPPTRVAAALPAPATAVDTTADLGPSPSLSLDEFEASQPPLSAYEADAGDERVF